MRGARSDDIQKDHPGGWENTSARIVGGQQQQLRLAPAFEGDGQRPFGFGAAKQ